MKKIRVTYLNNSGVMLRLGSTVLLLDGIIKEKNTFDTPPYVVKEYISENVFADECKSILVFTHCHDDHFGDEEVANAIKENEINHVIMPMDVENASLCIDISNDNNCIVFANSIQCSYEFFDGSVKIKIFSTNHLSINNDDNEDIKNYSVFVELNNKKFLFLGDTDPNYLEKLFQKINTTVDNVFSNPVIIGKEKYLSFLEKNQVHNLFIYHIPSEETDLFNYRSTAKYCAHKYKDCFNFNIILLLDKMKNFYV